MFRDMSLLSKIALIVVGLLVFTGFSKGSGSKSSGGGGNSNTPPPQA